MERYRSTGLIPDEDWANSLNYSSFERLTSSDDFGEWEFDPYDSKYDDFNYKDEDKDEELVTNYWKNGSEAWQPEGILVDPCEVDSRMEDLPHQQQYRQKIAEIQRTSAFLAEVKKSLDTVVRMVDNYGDETAAAKKLLVAFRGALGSTKYHGLAKKLQDRNFINMQRLQDSGSESDSDFNCFAKGMLMPAPPTHIAGRMEIDFAVPGPSSAARPSPPELENAQTAYLNRLVDKMERRVDGRTKSSEQEMIFSGEVEAPAAIPTNTGPKKKKKKKKGMSLSVTAPGTPDTSWSFVTPWAPVSPTSPPIPITSSSWVAQSTPGPASNGQTTWERTVPLPAAKKKKKKKKKKSKEVARQQLPQPQMLRPPKTAAIALTAAAGREDEFGATMAWAMSTVKVDELGIDKIRPKRAVSGGLLLEIRGAKAHAKAAALKTGLEKVLRGTGVRLSCPQKYAEIRICGLTELATPKSVQKAVAAAGGCEKEDVTVGELRRDSNGLFSVWARCPVRTAAKLAKDGQITVHPFLAKVMTLAQRPLQCHRCLEFGHVQHWCTSTVDRRNLCYRCGGTSHKAKDCFAAPRCPVCADLGVPANHRIGGQGCHPPPKKMMTGKLESGVAPAQAIPGMLPPETPTTSRKRKKKAKRPWTRERASDMSASSEPSEKRSKISTVAQAPLLPTSKVFPSVAAAGAAPRPVALKRACPVTNASTLTEMLSVALRKASEMPSSSTIAGVTAAPKAKKRKVADAGDSVNPPGTSSSGTAAVITAPLEAKELKDEGCAIKLPALVVQKDEPSTITDAAPSVDADPDVSLSVTATSPESGQVALQVSPQGVAPATNAKTTCDMLVLRQEAPGTTVVIPTALEPLAVQKDDKATVAKAAPAVQADSKNPSVDAVPIVLPPVTARGAAPKQLVMQVTPQGIVFPRWIPMSITRRCAES